MTAHKNSILPFKLAKILNARYPAVEYWRSVGLTPASKFFLPLCAELGLAPDGFGFEKKAEPLCWQAERLQTQTRTVTSSRL